MSRLPLTDRRKAQTRLEISRSALALFRRDGYDAVGAEAIAEHAGVSLRSFYRYFSTKDEALSPLIRYSTMEFATLVANRPATENLATAVQRGYEAISANIEAGGVKGMIGLLIDVPVLRARWLDDLRSIENALVPVIHQRSPRPLSPDQAGLSAAVIVTALRTSLEKAVREDSDAVVSTALGQALDYLIDGAGLATG